MIFKCEWIEGFHNNPKPKNVSIKELKQEEWNLDAYLGDDWIAQFIDKNIGETLDVFGPCGVSHTRFTRIK